MIVHGQGLSAPHAAELRGETDAARGLDKSGRVCQTMPESDAELNKRITLRNRVIDYHPIQRI